MKTPADGNTVKVLAVIPARAASKRIPRKNLLSLCGKPLLHYTIREAHASRLIDATIVSTEDVEIADLAKRLGADVPFLRPAEYASDTAKDIDYLRHALSWVEENRGWKPEYVAFLLPTTPSRTADDIDGALSFLMKEKADSVRTMVSAPHFNPYKMWVEAGEEGRVSSLMPAGTPVRAPWYMPVAALYATKTEHIRDGSLWGKDVRMVPFPLERFTDIDYPEDIAIAERVLKDNGLI